MDHISENDISLLDFLSVITVLCLYRKMSYSSSYMRKHLQVKFHNLRVSYSHMFQE